MSHLAQTTSWGRLPSTRRTWLSLIGACACCPLTGWARALAWPPSMALDYRIEGLRRGVAISASGALSWQRNEHAYEARLSSVAMIIFKREQISRGHLSPSGLTPHSFEDHRRRVQRADFDPASGIARYSNGSQMDWPANGQDRVSMLLRLGAWARQARPGAELELPVSDGNDWQTWAFNLRARETVDTPSGPWPSWHIQRSDAGRRGQSTDLWLATGLGGLPVRLVIAEANGDRIDQRLRHHRTLPPLPPAGA